MATALSRLTDREKATLRAALRLDSAIHDVPPEDLGEALLARTVIAFAQQGLTSEDFGAYCESRFRSMAPGFRLLRAL